MTKNLSHTTRPLGNCVRSFRDRGQILSVDPTERRVLLTGTTTMDQIVRELLPMGLLPGVIPEFKEITVGGAVMGAGLESSSFRHGQVFDVCESFELRTVQGQSLQVSRENHRDLFYGCSGSYGGFGELRTACLYLRPAAPWVELDFAAVSRREVVQRLMDLSRENYDFLDAVVWDGDRAVLMAARWRSEPVEGSVSLSRRGDPWFVQRIAEGIREKRGRWTEVYSTYDYLFRWDQAAFWMGRFVVSPSDMCEYLLKRWYRSAEPWKGERRPVADSRCLEPASWKRRLLGPWLSSHRLYQALHRFHRKIEDTFVVQDFYIPISNLNGFLDFVGEHTGIFPLWLCPMRGDEGKQFFSPNHVSGVSRYPELDFVNVGVYGLPTGHAIKITRELEEVCASMGGRKMLYAQNYYTEKEFWQIYCKDRWQELAAKYGQRSDLWKLVHGLG